MPETAVAAQITPRRRRSRPSNPSEGFPSRAIRGIPHTMRGEIGYTAVIESCLMDKNRRKILVNLSKTALKRR